MEADFNENDDNFLCAFEDELAWNTNPLFNNNNKGSTAEDFVHENNTNYREPKLANSVNPGEYETESGYSETVSIVSELSSPDPSVYSNLSFSDVDEETEFISEITESMRRSAILPPVGNDVDGTASGIIPAQIVSSKGTVRGVKNRVRENILHFLSSGQNGQKQKWRKAGDEEQPVNPDHGKVIMYTTSLGFVRSTQYECGYVKRVFHNLMVKLDERDLFVHPHFKKELQKRLGTEMFTLPQIFIDGKLIGDAKAVEKMVEIGTIKEALANVERVSHAQACSTCGGYKYVNCNKCSGSGKSRRTRISREINSLKCSSCKNGLLSCPECNS